MIKSDEFLVSICVTDVGRMVPLAFAFPQSVTTSEAPPERNSAPAEDQVREDLGELKLKVHM